MARPGSFLNVVALRGSGVSCTLPGAGPSCGGAHTKPTQSAKGRLRSAKLRVCLANTRTFTVVYEFGSMSLNYIFRSLALFFFANKVCVGFLRQGETNFIRGKVCPKEGTRVRVLRLYHNTAWYGAVGH